MQRTTIACGLGLVALILLYRRRKKIIGGVILRVAGSGAELHQTPRAAPEAPQSLATPHDGGPDRISAEQWALFDERGFVVLPREQVFEQGELEALETQLGDVGPTAPHDQTTTVQLDAPMVQLRYADEAGRAPDRISKGATLRYRKIEGLDLDPLVVAYLRKPLFDEACQRVYGATTPIASFRTVLSSQPGRHAAGAAAGTALPWQQDRRSYLGEPTPEPLSPRPLAGEARQHTARPARGASLPYPPLTPLHLTSLHPSLSRQTATRCSPPTWRSAQRPRRAAACSCYPARTGWACSAPPTIPAR